MQDGVRAAGDGALVLVRAGLDLSGLLRCGHDPWVSLGDRWLDPWDRRRCHGSSWGGDDAEHARADGSGTLCDLVGRADRWAGLADRHLLGCASLGRFRRRHAGDAPFARCVIA